MPLDVQRGRHGEVVLVRPVVIVADVMSQLGIPVNR